MATDAADCTLNNTCAPASEINIAGFPTAQVGSMGYRFWLALVILVIISGLIVATRIATRIQMRQMGADDYFIIAALVSLLIQSSFWGESVRFGYGSDYLRIDEWHRQAFLKYWWLGNQFFPITSYLYKTSALMLSKRIFIQRPFQIACWCIFTVNTCWFIANWVALLLECLPIPSMWGAAVAEQCISFDSLWISMVSWSVSMDVIILALPVPMIWQLHLKIADKLMLMGLFMLGAVVVVCSLMTCSAIVDGIQADEGGDDSSYTFALANLFEVIESNIGVIGACLPVLRAPITQWLPQWFSSNKTHNRTSYYYHDERFANEYGLKDISNQKDGSYVSRHKVSVSGGDRFKSASRRSDEIGIIQSSPENANGYEADVPANHQQVIQKDVSVSVRRS